MTIERLKTLDTLDPQTRKATVYYAKKILLKNLQFDDIFYSLDNLPEETLKRELKPEHALKALTLFNRLCEISGFDMKLIDGEVYLKPRDESK